jgi:hypothetical protein
MPETLNYYTRNSSPEPDDWRKTTLEARWSRIERELLAQPPREFTYPKRSYEQVRLNAAKSKRLRRINPAGKRPAGLK